jgi:hypothetical protein
LLERLRPQGLELFAQPAHPDADRQAALRQHVGRGQHFRGQHRVAVGQDHDAGDQAQAPGEAGDEGQQRQLFEGIAMAGEGAAEGVGVLRAYLGREHHMVGDDRRMKPQRLAAPDEGLQGFGCRGLAAGRQIESEFHGPSFPQA